MLILASTTEAQGGVSVKLLALVARARAISDTPIAVGFGISTPENAAGVAAIADDVIVGSAVVKRCGSEQAKPDVKTLVSELQGAMNHLDSERIADS